MQITLENLSGLERKLNITVPAEQVENQVKARLREIATKAKIPGFRPGKVPFDIIHKKYADAAHADVLEKLVRKTYPEALEQEKLHPAGMPQIKIISSKPNEQFSYAATFEIYPEVKSVDIKEAQVEKKVAQVTDSDVDEMLQKMQKSHATWQEVTSPERKVQAGDQITIDFSVKSLEGAQDQEVESKTEKGATFIVGDGSMWADFEQPLYGLGVGEEKQFVLQMPATHMDKKLAGNRAEFTVLVNKISQPILPALDDEFAAKLNIKEGGIAKLKEEVRAHMERELAGVLKDLFKLEILDKLLEHNPIEVPKVLIEDELKKKTENWQQRGVAARNKPDALPAFPRHELEPQIKRSIAIWLLMSEIIKEHKIAVSKQEVRKKIEELTSAYYEDQSEMVEQILSDQERFAEFELRLLEEKLVEHLAAQIKPIEKHISYKEAMTRK